MLRYLTQRFIAFVPTLLGVSILIFAAIRAVPGDAVVAMLSEGFSTNRGRRGATDEFDSVGS